MSQSAAPSPKPQKPASSTSKSNMKNLVGFLSGLVLATLIIIAVLLMINSNSQKDFKNKNEPVLSGTPPKETLSPNTNTPNISDNSSNNNVAQYEQPTAEAASDMLAKTNVETDPPVNNQMASVPAEPVASSNNTHGAVPTIAENNIPPKADANTRFNEPTFDDDVNLTPKPSKARVKPQQNNTSKNDVATRTPQTKPIQSQPKTTPKTTPSKNQAAPKPTPEQILDGGNIETAREMAKHEHAASQNTTNKKGTGVILQAGAFNSREYAESQRAKLAMLGVSAQISEGVVNGKKVYRVQTPKMSAEKANNAKAILNLNGVGVYERSTQ